MLTPADHRRLCTGEEPTVDDQGRAGHVAAGITGQEERGANQFFRVSPTAEDGSRRDGSLLLLGEDGRR
ncbi:hypothetical protein SAMN05444166_1373 [Singulisphaera sp. GP187]|nr:hypothetical protein SAMN05444166_1373 [Singulisphaera sp. GP187]